jgi:glycosyltransferase involved in cell wall biosynthesis
MGQNTKIAGKAGLRVDNRSSSGDPLVSVVVPCFNAARTLWHTLQSAQQQTYRNLEILIIDDGSTDSTHEIATKFAANDSRARVLMQPNSGVAAARNLGIAHAQGEFVAPLDADDLWAPQKVELQVKKILSDTSIGLVYAWFDNINDDDEIIPGGSRVRYEGHVLSELCAIDFVGNGSNPLMRTSAVREAGGYDPELRVQSAEGCEDWKLALCLAERYRFGVVPRSLVGYRYSMGNMSNRTAMMMRSARLVASEISIRHPELAETLHNHIGERLFTYSVKCLKRRRWKDAFSLMREASPYGFMWSLKRIATTMTKSAFRALPWLRRRLPSSRLGHRGRRKFLLNDGGTQRNND